MIIAIQNTIGAIRSFLGIVVSGLKMFLPFSSSILNANGQFSLDETTNNNNAKLFTGNCLDFDGSNDYVDAGNPNISLKTLVFWINLDSTTEQVMTLTSSQSILISSGTITLNGTWSGSVIYVDNVVTSTISASSYKRVVITTTSAITVNDLEFGRIGSDYGGFKMSDVQIWNSVWSATDVANDYANPNQLVSSVSVSNLKGWWALTEGSGSTAYDSSGESNNGTIINGATHTPAQSSILQLGMINWSNGSGVFLPPSPTNSAQDILGNAVRDRQNSLNQTGLDGYAEVADDNSLDFGTGAFSIDGWAKYGFTNRGSSLNVIYSHGGGATTSTTFAITTLASGVVRVYVAYAGGSQLATISNSISVGDWFYFSITRDGSGNCKFYLKEPSDANFTTQTFTSSGTVTNTIAKVIGTDKQANRQYENLIDDIRLYNIELSADEVLQNYNAGASAHTN
tara:strand:- start:378 stop:1742 length:1365 start_codon:yes stop_codon:yes gene_type:complete